MSEKTVQVPVSLLEQMQRYFRSGSDTLSRRMAAELTMVLSQPTPTAEPPSIAELDRVALDIENGINPSTIRDVPPPVEQSVPESGTNQ